MASAALVVLTIAGAAATAAPAGTDSPVHLEIEGAPAFSSEELARALLTRLPPDAPRGTLRVAALPDGSVELVWQGRRRVINLGDDRGAAAARVVALLAADLLLPLGLPLSPQLRDSAPSPASAPPAAPGPGTSILLAADYQVWSGLPKGLLLQGVGLAGGLDRPRLRLRASGGYLFSESNPEAVMTAWPLRLGVGAGPPFGALLANLVVVPYHLGGWVNVTRALVGLGLETQGRLQLVAGLALQATAGLDLYVNRRVEVTAGLAEIFAVPRATFRFGLGLSWEWAR